MSSREAVATTPLRRDRQFRRFWYGRLGSLTATSLNFVAYPVLVYALTGSSMWVSFVVAAQGVPYLLFGLFAGVVADRLDRRVLMAGSEAVNVVLLVSIPVAYAVGRLEPAHVVVVALLSRTAFVLYDAANLGALPTLVRGEQLPAAQSLLFGSSSVIELGVPGLAGLVLAVVSPALMFAVAAVLTAYAAVTIGSVTRPMSASDRGVGRAAGFWADLTDGVRWLWRTRDVRSQTLLAAAHVFAQGVLVAHMVAWVDLSLKPASPTLVTGILFGSWAAGGLAASAVVPWLLRRYGEARAALLLSPVPPVVALGSGFVESWPLAVVLVVVWGAGTMVVVLASLIHRQRRTPDCLRSRINTTGRVVSYGVGFPLGGLAAGLVAGPWGAGGPFILAGTVLAVAAVLGWSSGLRNESGPRTRGIGLRARGDARV
jgi:hypothetical protein